MEDLAAIADYLSTQKVKLEEGTVLYICLRMYVYTHVYVYTYIRTYIRTYIHAYIHAYIRSYVAMICALGG